MTSPDDEFDDFLRKRRPMFRHDDELEPPAELDRLVLRRARDAIETERPQRVFRAPSWGMPVALAATLVLAFTIILRVGTTEVAKSPEVTVQQVARQVEMAPAAAPPAPAEMARSAAPAEMARSAAPAEASADTARSDASGAMVVDIGADNARAEADSVSEKVAAAAPAGAAAQKPGYRRNQKSWLAEIDRLRAAGDNARADAELTEFKREHRAYAGDPNR